MGTYLLVFRDSMEQDSLLVSKDREFKRPKVLEAIQEPKKLQTLAVKEALWHTQALPKGFDREMDGLVC